MTIQFQIDASMASIIIAILAIFTIILSVSVVMLINKMKRIQSHFEDTNRLLYFVMKDSKLQTEKIDESMITLNRVEQNIEVLANGLQMRIQHEQQKSNQKHYPKPDEAKLITETIKEQIAIELVLRSEQKAPSGGALTTITENTMKTYPDVDPEYITYKCIAVVQDSVQMPRKR